MRNSLLGGGSGGRVNTSFTPSRNIAYDAFVSVFRDGRDPALLMDKAFEKNKLSAVDRRFVKEILFGGLRWYSKIFWILQNTASRDLKKTTHEVQAALVLGTYQIFYMDRVPDRAAVNESVEYIRHKGQSKAVTFVNGILRSIARKSEYFAKPDKDKKPAEYLALQYAHPLWLVRRWSRRFKFDKMKSLLLANNRVPPTSVRLNSLKVSFDNIQEFRDRLLRDERMRTNRRPLRSCLTLEGTPQFGEGSLFQQGYYTFQDESSQLIAGLLDARPDEFILDVCCGPGGKLSHIYELTQGKARVVGLDRNSKQLSKARENLARLGHKGVEIVERDFLEYVPDHQPDRILLDAPCSGLGVLRRHPEGKWRKTSSIIDTLVDVQIKLLEHSLKTLKKGGVLVYSVCSFEPEESLVHLKWLLDTHKDKIEVVSPVAFVPNYYKQFVTRENCLLIFSGNQDYMDGFSAFILRKVDDI